MQDVGAPTEVPSGSEGAKGGPGWVDRGDLIGGSKNSTETWLEHQ